MSGIKPFVPAFGTRVAVSVTATAASVLVGEPQAGNDAFRFFNSGTDSVIILITDRADTTNPSATNGLVLAPGSVEVIGKDKAHTRIAYIGGTGGNTLHITSGNGS